MALTVRNNEDISRAGNKKYSPCHQHSPIMSKANSPSYLSMRRCSHCSSSKMSNSIIDEIRNDDELFFGDDDDMEPPTSTASLDNLSFPPSLDSSVCNGQSSYSIHPRRQSTLGSSPSRRSSHKGSLLSKMSMENLQREVDMALDFFSQETLDDPLENCEDDEEFLNDEVFLPLETVKVRFHSEESDSLPGTASTSLATASDCGDFGDFHSNKFMTSLDRGMHSGNLSSSPPQTPRKSGSNGLSYKHRTKSILSLPLSLLPSDPQIHRQEEKEKLFNFETIIADNLKLLGITQEQHNDRNFRVDFDSNHLLRNAMEPFLAVARE